MTFDKYDTRAPRLCLLMFLLVSSPAHAAFIVDTGVPSGSTFAALGSTQWLAGEFTLAGPEVIGGASLYVRTGPGSDAIATTVAFYTDGGEVPGSEIFSTDFLLSTASGNSWQGVSGLSLALPAGTYWVAFEPRQCAAPCAPTVNLAAAFGVAPSPLANYAFYEALNPGWGDADSLALGIRISPVPVPAAVWLFGSALGLLVWRRRTIV